MLRHYNEHIILYYAAKSFNQIGQDEFNCFRMRYTWCLDRNCRDALRDVNNAKAQPSHIIAIDNTAHKINLGVSFFADVL